MDQEQEYEPSLSSVLGALKWIALWTRPDICWAVTRVSRAAKSGESEQEVEDKAREHIKHILQYLALTGGGK
eukprot:811450-Prorocentrum_lima.AAC.1